MALVAVKVSIKDADAEHSYLPHRHINSILLDSDEERSCVRVLDDSIGLASAQAYVRAVLDISSPDGWDGTKFVDVRGYMRPQPCPDLPVEEPAFFTLRLHYLIRNDWDEDPCGDQSDGCQVMRYAYDDPESGHYQQGQFEWRVGLMHMDTPALKGEPAHIINHESGHAFGLRDGGPGAPGPSPHLPPTPIHGGLCTGSVMHSYGCGPDEDLAFPTLADRVGVEDLVPSASGSSGIGGGIPKYGG